MNLTMPIILVSVLVSISVLILIVDQLMGSQEDKKIVINGDIEIPVEGSVNLLTALADNKFFIPSACGGKATCGHCKVKIDKGGGATLPTEDIFLSKKEKNENIRLACQVKVKEDLHIELPEELLSVQEYQVELIKMVDLTHDIKLLTFKLIDPDFMEFKAGQYAQIFVPGLEVFRAYSIASKPSDKGIIEFIIRLVPGGVATTYVHKALDVGDKGILTGPYGDFYLQEDSDRDIICIAGGSGKAPIRSILFHMQDKDIRRNVKYFFGARTSKDLYYTEELQQLEKDFPNFEYIPALSHPLETDEWDGETGLITDVIDRNVGSLSNSEAYLCGSPGMIDACNVVLTKHGLPEEFIYYDKF